MAKRKVNRLSVVKRLISNLNAKINYGMALLVLAGAGLVLLLAVALDLGWQTLIAQPEFMVYPSAFQIDMPSWATPELGEEIRRTKGLERSYSIFEPGLTHKIAKIYEKCPWVYKVMHIRREFPNRVRMKLMLRKPVAAVQVGRVSHLADEDAVRLPRKFYIWPPPAFDVPRVFRDGLEEPLPEPGKAWQDRGVRAGVLLAKFLGDRNMIRKFKITVIDTTHLGRRSSDSPIVLVTEQQTRILWGSSSLCHAPGELTDEQKLVNLIAVGEAEKYDFSRLAEIDVRWDRPYGKSRSRSGRERSKAGGDMAGVARRKTSRADQASRARFSRQGG